MKRIYCAGPLFNPREREDMEIIAASLEIAGYKVFLPHRDGIEMAKLNTILVEKGCSIDEANSLLARAVFMIDTYQIIENDGLVLNLNGRVPDEGAMVEGGIAWALGKPVVIYKNDSRSLLGGLDNPLVAGLSKFKIISEIDDIPLEFNQSFLNGYKRFDPNTSDYYKLAFEKGKNIFETIKNTDPDRKFDEFIELLLD